MKNDTPANGNKSITMVNLKLTAIILAFLMMFAFLFCLPMFDTKEMANAFNLEEKVDDDFVAFYEKEIAKSPIISSMNKGRLDQLKAQYNLSDKRLTMLLILEDFGMRAGSPKDFAVLTEMSDKQLFLYGKTLVDEFSENLDKDKKDQLTAQFLALVKKK